MTILSSDSHPRLHVPLLLLLPLPLLLPPLLPLLLPLPPPPLPWHS
jgi:hypothetical protein